ncbi:unnamed protein product [Effrenium voratum]|nr:unnamed protein product [Effrenium voratum]CAJ1440222.1 unnamed protein product [Effrenium voratum]
MDLLRQGMVWHVGAPHAAARQASRCSPVARDLLARAQRLPVEAFTGSWRGLHCVQVVAPCLAAVHASRRARIRRAGVSLWELPTLPLPTLVPAPDFEEAPGQLHQAYGPVGLQSLKLDGELLAFLENACAGDPERLSSMGFCQCVDHAALPEHHYMEGYFHTLGSSAVVSANPRTGGSMPKPAANLQLRAFAQSLRAANAEVLCKLAADCPEGSLLQKALREGRAFADLAVQIHWGQAVRSADVQWHIDAPNSALHMAVSVHGGRTLKMKLRDPFALDTKIVDERQEPGDVYIGNPAAFEHGLEYDEATWETRMIALQLRLLFTEEELGCPNAAIGMDALAKGVASQKFRLPSMEEVRQACESLRDARN